MSGQNESQGNFPIFLAPRGSPGEAEFRNRETKTMKMRDCCILGSTADTNVKHHTYNFTLNFEHKTIYLSF